MSPDADSLRNYIASLNSPTPVPVPTHVQRWQTRHLNSNVYESERIPEVFANDNDDDTVCNHKNDDDDHQYDDDNHSYI